ncbi:Cathepsin [Dirofilaria immitis]
MENCFINFIIILLLFFVTNQTSSIINDTKYLKLMEQKLGNKHLMQQYADYKLYKRKYNKPDEEINLEHRRFMIYLENIKEIEKHNERYRYNKETYKMGINHLADMLPEEFDKLLGFVGSKMRIRNKFQNISRIKLKGPLPDKIDWRDSGAVTAIKDQGNCGSCWAFSAVGALEGQHFLQTGKLINFSEQNLIDCSSNDNYDNYGCLGGFILEAFRYVVDNDGINTEESYPYDGYENSCRFSTGNIGTSAYGARSLPVGDELQLQAAIAMIGPISVAINASTMKFYQKGIISTHKCSTGLNHAVLAIGYGTELVKLGNGTKKLFDYWLIKNSWGNEWGINGYLKLARNQNNMCGIGLYSCYPNHN